jgi:hypothetical protein
MGLPLYDRVKETTTSTGTGTVTLAGAALGYQSFAAVGTGNQCYYVIEDPTNGPWEVGVGTYTASGTTLARNTVLSSSNANALVNFAAGTKNVFLTVPASVLPSMDAGPRASLPSTARPAGSRYRCNDSPYEFVSNGSSWDAYAFGYKVVEPVLASFTQVNCGLSTFSTAHGGILQTVPAQANAENTQILAVAVPPTGPYYADCAFTYLGFYSNGGVGVGFNGGTSPANPFTYVQFGWQSNAGFITLAKGYPSATGTPGAGGQIAVTTAGPLIWLRCYDDRSATRSYYISVDGYNWYAVYSEARTLTFTPAYVSLVACPFNTTSLVHWLHFSAHT